MNIFMKRESCPSTLDILCSREEILASPLCLSIKDLLQELMPERDKRQRCRVQCSSLCT
jgi:hypothetical protein